MAKVWDLLIFWMVVSFDTSMSCDIMAVNSCMRILSDQSESSEDPSDTLREGIAAIPSENKLQKLCGSLSKFKACYNPKAKQCAGDILFSMTLGTIQDTLNYLCVEGYRDVMRYTSCWNQSLVVEGTTGCHATQTEMILDLRITSDHLPPANQRERWCRILSNTTSCMGEVVEAICGPSPACVMSTMMARALSGLSRLMKCQTAPPCSVITTDTTNTTVTRLETRDTIFINKTTTQGIHNEAATTKPSVYVLVFLICQLFLKIK